VRFHRIKMHFQHQGRIARLTLAAPKANILDRQMMAELNLALQHCAEHPLHAIVIGAEGPHFSFGASVQEHMPDQIVGTLATLHALLRRLASASAPTIAAVQGRCLGGGFELALGCDLMMVEDSAIFAAPEVKLGVFAPAASALLPVKVGSARAAGLLLTGVELSAFEAFSSGLANRLAPKGFLDPELEAWLDADFLSRPPVTLRCAAEAARWAVREALDKRLPVLERLYLDKLMAAPEPLEGLKAFIEKREPEWHLQLH